jgi:hypothetical protein
MACLYADTIVRRIRCSQSRLAGGHKQQGSSAVSHQRSPIRSGERGHDPASPACLNPCFKAIMIGRLCFSLKIGRFNGTNNVTDYPIPLQSGNSPWEYDQPGQTSTRSSRPRQAAELLANILAIEKTAHFNGAGKHGPSNRSCFGAIYSDGSTGASSPHSAVPDAQAKPQVDWKPTPP